MCRFVSRVCQLLLVAIGPTIVHAQAAGPPIALPSPGAVRGVIDSLAADFAAANKVPGTAIAVVRGTDTLLFRGYGKSNLELGTPVTVNTVFRIGSVTKQFTSAAVLQLIEAGKLTLTDSIGQWVADLPMAWRGITVQQLLNHTSGIPSYTALGEPWIKRWGEEMTGAQLVALTAARSFDFPAGTSWAYNNTGYVLLGMLVESRAGRNWGDDFSARFFAPLGLSRTRYCETQAVIPDRASGYSMAKGTVWVNAAFLAMSQPHAAGAMCSTIGDLLTWNRALHSGAVLKPVSYTGMTTPSGAAEKRQYGFGMGRADLGGHVMLTHSGGINGALTANLYIPDAKLSVTVLTNGDQTDPGRVALQLARAALGIPLEQPPRAVAITPAELRVYAGVYELVLDTARPFTVAEKDGRITGTLEGQGPTDMIPLGNHTFGATFDPSVRITFAVVDGKATRMTLLQNGRRSEGLRRP